MSAIRWTLALLTVGFACTPRSRPIESPRSAPTPTETLERDIPAWVKAYGVPGLSVAVIEQGRIVWSSAYGRQSPTQSTDNQTLYDVASLSKPVTAEVFLRLVAAGRVSLDEPMAAHWVDPDIADDPRTQQLTPRHVLTHRTGFKNWRRMTGGKLRFEHAPGTVQGYSGEGFQYLVRFVERKLGVNYQKLADEVLFGPAKLADISFVFQPWFRNREAWPMDTKGIWHEDNVQTVVEGASELHATAQSYARFMAHVLNDRTLPPDLLRQRLALGENRSAACREEEGMSDICPTRMGFGLGWYIYDFDDETLITHTGNNSYGEKSLAVYSPSRQRGLVVLSNGAHARSIIYKIAQRLDWPSNFIKMSQPSEPIPTAQLQLSRDRLRDQVELDTVALDTEIEALIVKHKVAGVGVGVLRRGHLVWTGYYGHQAPGVPVSYQTMFNTASVAKSVTAETLLHLADAGHIDLDESIAPYVKHPDLSKDPRYSILTPRLLMSHRAGLLNWAYKYPDRKLAFVHDPGTQFSYSGAGVDLAAQYAEAKLGVDFEELARTHVWIPAKVRRMRMGRRFPELAPYVAHPMDKKGEFQAVDAFSWRLSPRSDGRWSAADDLLTSVNDYAHLLEHMLAEHRPPNGNGETAPPRTSARTTLLTDISDNTIWRCEPTPDVRCPQRYGHSVGWMVHDFGEHRVIHHGGNDQGENAMVYFSPDAQHGAVIFVNGGNGMLVSVQILERLGDEPGLAAHFRQLIERHTKAR